jgi:hypothetical protein
LEFKPLTNQHESTAVKFGPLPGLLSDTSKNAMTKMY